MSFITLDDKKYEVVGPIQISPTSGFAPVINSGETPDALADPQRASQTYRDQRGGLGIERTRPGVSNDRYWTTQLDASRYQQLQLPRKIEEIGAPTGASVCRWLGTLGGALYAIFDRGVYKYVETINGGSWSDQLGATDEKEAPDLTGDIADNITSTINEAKVYIAYGAGVVIINPNADENSLEVDVRENAVGIGTISLVQTWTGNVYGLSSTDRRLYLWLPIQLEWEIVASNEALPDTPTSLTNLNNASGARALYCTTDRELFVLDADLTTWVSTGYSYPFWANNGVHSVVWRDTLNIPNRDANLTRYQPGDRALVSPAGPTQDDGLPRAPGYEIQGLVGELNYLYLFLRRIGDSVATDISSNGLRLGGSPLGHRTVQIGQISAQSYILEGREGGAWNPVYDGRNYSDNPFEAQAIGTVSDNYGIWFAQDGMVRYLPLQQVFNNPNQDTRHKFVSTTQDDEVWQEHVYPFFDGDDLSISKLATSLYFEADCPANTKIAIGFYKRGSRSEPQTIVTCNGEGVITGESGQAGFPNSSNKLGTEFDTIRLFVRMLTYDETKTPVLYRLGFAYRRKLNFKLNYGLQLKLNEKVDDRSPTQMLREIRDLARETRIVPLRIGKPNSGDPDDEPVYVVVTNLNYTTVVDSSGNATIPVVSIACEEE